MKKLYITLAAILMATVASQAVTVEEICGNYDWVYQSELGYDGGVNSVPVEITPGTSPKTVKISGMYLDYVLVADVDVKAGTLSLRSQSIDSDMNLGILYLYKVTEDGEDLKAEREPIVANITSAGIFFDPKVMIGIGYPDLNAYYLLASSNSFTKAEDHTFVFNPEEWNSLGMGHFTDGWLSYHFYGEDFVANYEVEIRQNKENPNRYCVMNPFKHREWEEFNQDPDAEGHIVFDITDPEFVIVEPYIYSGFTDAEFGKLYMYSMETNQYLVQGNSPEDLKVQIPNNIAYFKNDVLTIPDPIFGHEKRPTGLYGWTSDTSESTAVIRMPDTTAVAAIEAAVDAEAEYYTLQGVRVDRPACGMYICQKGGKASKVVIK